MGHVAGMRVMMARMCLALLAGVTAGALWAPLQARAEDEDTSSSVYLVFDPETGDFVTMDDPDAALPNQTGLEPHAAPSPHASGHGADDESVEDAPVAVIVLAGLGLLVALGGFLFLFLRKRRAA